MGSLDPGANYVYERVDDRIYARKYGETQRQLVGWTSSAQSLAMRQYLSEINEVLTMCERDPAMRELLEQLFVLYNLKKHE